MNGTHPYMGMGGSPQVKRDGPETDRLGQWQSRVDLGHHRGHDSSTSPFGLSCDEQ